MKQILEDEGLLMRNILKDDERRVDERDLEKSRIVKFVDEKDLER